MSVAQLPGSMYPTETRYAGPAKARSRRKNPRASGIATVEWTSERDFSFDIGLFPRGKGKGEFDPRPLRKVAHRENAVVLVRDAGTDGQAEARPAVLRGKERVEDPLQLIRRYDRPGVGHPDNENPLLSLALLTHA